MAGGGLVISACLTVSLESVIVFPWGGRASLPDYLGS